MKTKLSKTRLAGLAILIVLCLFFLPVGCKVLAHYASGDSDRGWGSMRRDSSEQAPDPATTQEAVIQVYAARAARWRGAFGVHTWIATKPRFASHYQRLEVFGYALRWSGKTVRVRVGQPDSYWFGNKPYLLREVRGGEEVDQLIEKLHLAANNYVYNDQYDVWPGPNSNTFIAHLARVVPELNLELPATAIGKDYLPQGALALEPPSGHGFQLSAKGLLGIIIAPEEGLEINLLGLTAGIDVSPLALKLPGVGRVGFSDFERIIIPSASE